MKIGGRLVWKGTLNPATEKSSRFGVGMEKLDRDAFDYHGKIEKMGALGLKWVRINSGWEKTERQVGVYDFSWLDEIVDSIIQNGMEPWICLGYGNPLYSEQAKEVFGSVGCPPIFSEREKQAWDNYCTAIVRHYVGKVRCFEIWNEPDHLWKHSETEESGAFSKRTALVVSRGKEYGEFAARTAKAIRRGNENAYIVGGAQGVGTYWAKWLKDALENGLASDIDAFSYHRYSNNVESNVRFCKQLGDLLGEYCQVELIHGESGCPSSIEGNGALHANAWTQETQAKLLLRMFAVDFSTGVKFSSWFSAVDMIESLYGKRGDVSSYRDYGYFGLLESNFDSESGVAIGDAKPKQSYYALQNMCSVITDDVALYNVIYQLPPAPYEWSFDIGWYDEMGKDFFTVGLKKKNGAKALIYYKPTPLHTTKFESTVSWIFQNVQGDVHIVDLLSGSVYGLSEEMIERQENAVLVKHIPVKDYPLMITFGDFCNWE